MKKVIFALTFVCLTLVTYSQDVNPIADSSKVTFTKVYNDVKSGINGLASALKVGATHVYSVLVKQQVVYAISYLILIIFLLISSVICITIFVRNYNREKRKNENMYIGEEFSLGGMLAISIILTIFTILSIAFNMSDIIMGLYNPEYGAIKDILDFVRYN